MAALLTISVVEIKMAAAVELARVSTIVAKSLNVTFIFWWKRMFELRYLILFYVTKFFELDAYKRDVKILVYQNRTTYITLIAFWTGTGEMSGKCTGPGAHDKKNSKLSLRLPNFEFLSFFVYIKVYTVVIEFQRFYYCSSFPVFNHILDTHLCSNIKCIWLHLSSAIVLQWVMHTTRNKIMQSDRPSNIRNYLIQKRRDCSLPYDEVAFLSIYVQYSYLI